MERNAFSPNMELSHVCDQMWKADSNRLVPEVDYAIDPQGKTRFHSRSDQASDPLFTWVNPEALRKPTYDAFVKLLDNYASETGKPEVVNQEEINENRVFIDRIYDTGPMEIAHKFLAGKGLVPSDRPGFKKKLYQMWFELYQRTRGCRVKDSSGFEHVFVGETRGKEEVIGFHNWIQFYLQEKAGVVDYKGFFPNRNKRMSTDAMKECQLVTIQFSWKSGVKPIGSSFIGTSPEFEMALYTVCFLAGGGHDVHLDMEDYDVIIKIHTFHGGKYIGSCYPQAV